jgi:hypothetical protein
MWPPFIFFLKEETHEQPGIGKGTAALRAAGTGSYG